ncbi:aspartate racemase [Deinobacterium chartae]|uniref:Aspartate racemase n=1 Tax=Deinobacterium chartae TaxID=521158 RepID=A0A841I1U4_9DEIO|nr:aspartate/glutamate racemase family protein [Deinobacterium chartae]MBB6099223.1 aspartate racemase [Deinobacterium chartae]
MKTIGLIGGMSWESTAIYYRHLNEAVRARFGGLRSAQVLLYSFDFDQVVQLQRADRWNEAAELLADVARRLEAAGADLILICTNTMHLVYPQVQAAVTVPVLHIADTTAQAVRAAGLNQVGLLATAFSMERSFLRERLEGHGLSVLVPEADDRAEVHRVIFEELCQGVIRPESKAAYLEAAERLIERGAQGILLGCTEICMLISQADLEVPVFDTTRLHALAALELALVPEPVEN